MRQLASSSTRRKTIGRRSRHSFAACKAIASNAARCSLLLLSSDGLTLGVATLLIKISKARPATCKSASSLPALPHDISTQESCWQVAISALTLSPTAINRAAASCKLGPSCSQLIWVWETALSGVPVRQRPWAMQSSDAVVKKRKPLIARPAALRADANCPSKRITWFENSAGSRSEGSRSARLRPDWRSSKRRPSKRRMRRSNRAASLPR